MKTYRGPIPMKRIDGAQLRTVAAMHKFVGLECSEGWNLSQLAFAYRLRGRIIANKLNDMPPCILPGDPDYE